MRVNLIVIGVIIFSIITFAKSDICKSYNGKDFFLEKILYKKNKDIREKIKIDNLKIYFFKDRNSGNPITLEYTINKHKRLYKYIDCRKNGNKEWCGLECDGGGFYANKSLDILIKYPLIISGEVDSELPILAITQKNSKKYIKGKSFTCPKVSLRAKKQPDEKYYKDNAMGKYVCYTYKSDKRYNGCIRSIKRCKDLHLQHFGKYETKEIVKDAFERCKSFKPNQDYLENSNGKYVCYDYIDDSGEYNGCFTAIKSCKELHKKHFGQYSTIKKSQKALVRCKVSLPEE